MIFEKVRDIICDQFDVEEDASHRKRFSKRIWTRTAWILWIW